MRGPSFFLAALLLIGPLLVGRPATASTPDLVAQLEGLVKSFPGGAGLWIADPNSPTTLFVVNAEEQVIAASLYKLGVLAEAERRVETGELRYTDPITIEPEDVTQDGSFEHEGTVLTLDEALESMVTISDNGTALALWHILGGTNIDSTLANAGMPDFHVALNDNDDNVVTPHAVGTFFSLLAAKRLISAAASQRMLDRLARQRINDRLPASLPTGVVVCHKTGNLVGLVHDAGIIYAPTGPRVVVAMTWDAPDEEADSFIASVGAIVYSAVLEPPANAKYQVPKTAVDADTNAVARVTVPITNTGTRPWTVSGPSSFGIIWEMRDSKKAVVASSKAPTPLPALGPNTTAQVAIAIDTPRTPGDYTVTIGLANANGVALAQLGAATATFGIRTHQAFIVAPKIQMPTLLHRAEASLLITQYSALPPAGSIIHSLTLTWRLIDPRGGRQVASGTSLVGTLQPGASGTFFSPFVAPNQLGTYKLSYELRDRGVAASATVTTTVTIGDPRTYPDDQGGRIPGARALPTPTPRFRFPIPSFQLPTLPSIPPKGKATPTPTPH